MFNYAKQSLHFFCRPQSVFFLLGSSSIIIKMTAHSNSYDINTPTTFLESNPLLRSDLIWKTNSGTLPLTALLPRFQEISPHHVQPAIDKQLKQLKNDYEKLVDNIRSGNANDFVTIVEEVERIKAPLTYTLATIQHMINVNHSDELQFAFNLSLNSVFAIFHDISQSQVIFRGLQSLKDSETSWASLDEVQRRVVTIMIRDMQRSGVGLSSSDRLHFNKLQHQCSELQSKFNSNLMKSLKSFKITLKKKSSVEGLPASLRKLLSQHAVSEGHRGATAEEGPWVITLDSPTYYQCMKHLGSRRLREVLYRAFVTRASSGDHDNSVLIPLILKNKREIAQLLGYDHYADMSLATKAAPGLASVLNTLAALHSKALPRAQQEMTDLKIFARQEMGLREDMELWDVLYYSERYIEKKFNFNEEELKMFFSFDEVLKGLFSLVERLFSVRIVEVARGDCPQVWHSDVRFYKVYDMAPPARGIGCNSNGSDSDGSSGSNCGGSLIAAFYLDPYARPGQKKEGNWMSSCVGKSRALRQNTPVAYMVLNSGPPDRRSSTPALMTLREVENLFHEMGHALQHMLTTVQHGAVSGVSNIEWDLVEFPSQFMENWVYDRDTLISFSKHYVTKEMLSDELYSKIIKSKNFQSGEKLLHQLHLSTLDLSLHSVRDPDQSLWGLLKDASASYKIFKPLPEECFVCSFPHIFTGGYSAGYYGYIWSEIISADAFSVFEEKGMHYEQNISVVGRCFRDTVLAMGGGYNASDVYQLFRRRNVTIDAFLRHNEIR